MEDEKYMLVPPISPCVGDYDEADTTCTGDGSDEIPCSWKQRCIAFQRYLKAGGEIERHLKIKEGEKGEVFAIPIQGDAGFAKYCDGLIERYKALDEEENAKKPPKKQKRPAHKDKRKYGPSKQAKVAAAKSLKKRAQRRRMEMMEGFDAFKSVLEGALGKWKFAIAGQVVFPGQMYIADRIITSSYAAIYCQAVGAWSIPVALVRFKTLTMEYSVAMPISMKQATEYIAKSVLKKLGLREVDEGKFRVESKNLDRFGLCVAAEVVAKLVNDGIILLPEP